MLYLPDQSYLPRFEHLMYPLPPRLLQWLYSLGLSIYVLPRDQEAAKNLLLRVTPTIEKFINLPGGSCFYLNRAHYSATYNTIFIPHESLYAERGESVLLHEVGHAIDFNYSKEWNAISNCKYIWDALRKQGHLNKYCEDKFKETGYRLEDFACSFVAYFQEPDANILVENTTVDRLNTTMVQFFKQKIMENFQ